MQPTRPSPTTSPSNLRSTIATHIDDCQRATGGMRVDSVDIVIDDNSKPVFAKQCCIPYGLRKPVKDGAG